MGQDDARIGAFDGEIICETPNNLLNKFEGTLIWKGMRYSLDNDKVVLRGCVLRNTQWCYGVVIFAGKDTKLMQNSGKTKFKRTSIDRLLNFIIIGIVFFLLSMCLFCMIACGIWETITGRYFQVYLPWDTLVPSEPLGGATVIALLVFFSYAIVLNTVVPISLYVSVEVIRFAQSFLINWDEKMYYEKSGTAAKARTTTLNEELGQIEYIFSDKTGTLTQNIMTFNKCSIAARCYGDIIDETTNDVIEVTEHTPHLDFSNNPNYEPEFRFYDSTLLQAVRKGDEDVHSFFRLLALCHTVMPEDKNGKLEYQAQSPDEAALVSAARNFGFVFKERSPNSITIEVMGQREVYELLCILDFNNVRKRMSVILRRNGQLRLYCKGADNVIYERLKAGNRELKTKTQEHLNKFAGEGLRTLCLAVRDLDEVFFNNWKHRHQEAAVSMENRDEKLDAIYEEIETDMTLLGATAIEDKLQDGVPQAIANLAMADIKMWVLTGDKQETAINIGYSCQLLTDEMADIFIVDAHTFDEVELQLIKLRESIRSVAKQQSAPTARVGISTRVQRGGERKRGRLRCRHQRPFAGPRSPPPTRETVPGGIPANWSQGLRCHCVMLYRHKGCDWFVSSVNLCDVLSTQRVRLVCFQTVFDPMFISVYNLFYTSLPVLGLGIFDQDVSDRYSLMYPQLYTPGHSNLLFNKKEFLRSALHGFFTSCVLFLIPYGTYKDGVSPKGYVLSDHMLLGSVVATILVIVVTAQIALDTSYWTVFNHFMV
uniref:Phospholipid-transporting ATPase n=1 Tax=Timema californicum TaxID=61474 RepID=A0A7R9J925_TIMCA|nr:unnamed protein product [Timema californicum]